MQSHKKLSKTLILGSGGKRAKNAITVDINPQTKAEIIHDLNKFPYPFKDNQFEKVIAENILEHLDEIPKVLEEIHRISKNKAIVFVSTGHFSAVDSFTDPTHKHFFTSRSFDYFIPGQDLYKYKYSKSKFKKISVSVGPPNASNPLIKLILKIINMNLVFYEKRFAFMFPVGVISYELEVTK